MRMADAEPRVLTSVEDHVAHVRLNRANKRNGLDYAMFMGLIEAGEAVAADSTVRAVVLSGEGPSFCAGLDFASFLSMPDGADTLLARDSEVSPANVAQRTGWIWQEVPVPVIAAVHGACFGGGLQVALGADIRIVHPEAEMSVMEMKWGLIPDMGITRTLLPLVGLDVAKELTFTARRFPGTEAHTLGLATRLSLTPLDDALALAGEIATKNPFAIRASKQMLNDALDLDVAGAFKLETDLQRAILGSANQVEAVQANMMKRAPRFADPDQSPFRLRTRHWRRHGAAHGRSPAGPPRGARG